MVEEKESIEIEIYGLCEKITKLNNENIKKFGRTVDEEKIVYIKTLLKIVLLVQ